MNIIRSGGPIGSAVFERKVACTPKRLGLSDGLVGRSIESNA